MAIFVDIIKNMDRERMCMCMYTHRFVLIGCKSVHVDL